jgi:hypothetical protein
MHGSERRGLSAFSTYLAKNYEVFDIISLNKKKKV